MKLNTSFTEPGVKLYPVLAVGSWLVAFVMLCLSVYLVYASQNLQAQNTEFLKRLDKLQRKQQSFESSGADGLQSYLSLKKRVREINQISGMQGMDVSVLLSQLESLIPQKTFIASVDYSSARDELYLVAESAENNRLTVFVELLESSRMFNDVRIVRQSQVQVQNQLLGRIELRLANTPAQSQSAGGVK